MATTLLFSFVSFVAFALWFRMCCLHLLQTRTWMDYLPALADSSDLAVFRIRERLDKNPSLAELDAFRRQIRADYETVNRLLGQFAANQWSRWPAWEARLLRADYRLMCGVDSVWRLVAGCPSAGAVREMSEVVAFLANSAGFRLHQTVKS